MRTFSFNLTACLAFVMITAVGEREAFACECSGLPSVASVGDSDVIYIGRVTAIREGRRFAWPEIEFSVRDKLKGPVGKAFVLQTGTQKGMSCEGFDFTIGKTYLVLAAERYSITGRAGTYGVNWCAGTTLVDTDEGKKALREVRKLIKK